MVLIFKARGALSLKVISGQIGTNFNASNYPSVAPCSRITLVCVPVPPSSPLFHDHKSRLTRY